MTKKAKWPNKSIWKFTVYNFLIYKLSYALIYFQDFKLLTKFNSDTNNNLYNLIDGQENFIGSSCKRCDLWDWLTGTGNRMAYLTY